MRALSQGCAYGKIGEMKKWLLVTIFLLALSVGRVSAAGRPPALGVHILHPGEMSDAISLLKTEDNRDQWTYVTIPLSLDDLGRHDEWQGAFAEAKKRKINPIVRLTSRFDPQTGAWAVPTRGEIIQLFAFLSDLEWPRSEKLVIAFNEPNHASEWGGRLDPGSYARVLEFVIQWAHTEFNDYRILPAGMDLAAPNGSETMAAFDFLAGMLSERPEIFAHIDYWNSHSYPNPAFSSSPAATGQNSLRGFQHELAWLEEKAGVSKQAYITETGWDANSKTTAHLDEWYQTAWREIWADKRVLAVTPFVLRGDPGPFSGFTLIDKDNRQTRQYEAYRAVVEENGRAYREYIGSFHVPKF